VFIHERKKITSVQSLGKKRRTVKVGISFHLRENKSLEQNTLQAKLQKN
jgi:hypothetical protein